MLQLDGEEIVPWLEEIGGVPTPRSFDADNFRIEIFRLRTGGPSLRIERWTHVLTGRIHFRTRDAQNAITIFGARAGTATRIVDPDDESRTLAWLPEVRIDARGNAIWLDYVAEDARGLNRADPSEGGRTASAQRYLKRIRYANAQPIALDDELVSGTLDDGLRWCFQLVFDYGDHAQDPAVEPDRAWPARPDATSTYRAGFDVRTHRLCRRILTFHHFDELGASPVLVDELRLEHELDPAGSVLRSIREVGHRVDGSTHTSAETPALVMAYAPPVSSGAFTRVPAESTANVPAGLLGQRCAFVDLFGEGLPGILAETDGAWYWKPNLGGGRFGAQAVLTEKPAVRRGAAGLGDHDRDGDTDLAQLTGRFAGAFELDRDAGAWQEFRPLSAVPHVEALGGRAQWVDLNGDGRADLLIAQADRFLWFPSGDEGFEAAVDVPKPPGVPATLGDAELDFYFADMNGDGLPDLVRVQNGRIEYWPNLGNGRFAAGVVMDGAPWISNEGEIDPSRLRFVDLDGTGTSDLLYLGQGEIRAWINAGGNRFVEGPHLRGLPYLDRASSVRIVDLLGDGRPCLAWSSPLPGADTPLQYLPLVPEVRPRLLLSVEDSVGQETRLVWGHSAQHYLRDVAAGRGWSTKLPSHVSVVDRLETYDRIGGTSEVRRYEYRDGFYDGAEREWRGFGQVDIFDADTADGVPAPGEPGFAAPTLTRTWFHLGTEMWNHRRPVDAYDADPQLPLLPTHVCDASLAGALPSELDDALRALAGREIRSEVYAVDAEGHRGEHPFTVTQHCARVRRVQPAHRAYAAAFSVIEHESVVATYDQVAADPRVEGHIVVETDAFDQPTRDAAISYARRAGRPRDADAQDRTSITVHDFALRNLDLPERFELGIPLEGRDIELSLPVADLARVTRERLRAPDVAAALAAPAPHHTTLGPGLGARLLGWDRSYYWNDDATAALAFGEVGALARVHHEESAVFAPAFVADVYGARVDTARLTAAGYTLRDGLWWQSDDVHLFGPAARFSQREGIAHRDGTVTRMTLDAYALEQVATVDPSGHQTTTEIDYCALEPRRATDANGAIAETLYDALGVAVVTTARGAIAGQPWGMDLLAAYTPRPAPTSAQQVLEDPAHYLQGAGQFTYYDVGAWQREGAPVTVVQLSAEELRADGAGGGTSTGRIAIAVSYLDGFGRVLQDKQLVDAGDAIARDASGGVVVDAAGHPVLAPADPRWRCSGHVTYDRKQRPVRTHEPFHTGSSAYEGDAVLAELGVATIELYDAIGRPVRRDFPNGTFERTTYGPWRVERADANDTVFESTYRLLRESRPVDDPERQAYEHALAHRDTTTAAVLDPRGLEVAVIANGGTAGTRRTETQLDVEGQPRSVIDARGIVAFEYLRDMEGRELYVRSADAGETWTLYDVDGRIATTWDSAGYEALHTYDVLDRPRQVIVRGNGLDHVVEARVYGEDLPLVDARARNLLGRLVTVRDQVGELTVNQCDPTGAVLSSTRRVRATAAATTGDEADWSGSVALGESFTSQQQLDALGRVRRSVLADGTVQTQRYGRDGTLAEARITTPDGALVDHPIVTSASHDARGLRQQVSFGNGVTVTYEHDRETFRATRQLARRGARTYQDIRYTYDPIGSIVRIHDHAHDPGPAAVITGTVMPARRDYVYDAHYRLTRATGRLHQALLERDYIPGIGSIKGTRHLDLNNGAALETFVRTYEYDLGNNLHTIRHTGASRAWVTALQISATSNRAVPTVDPNGIPISAADAAARFDAVGNLLRLDHLRQIRWSWRGSLAHAVLIERGDGTNDSEGYAYGADGLRVRKVSERVVHGGQIETVEKIYLGDAERKRILRDGAVIFERWTTHVSDGTARVALVHRWVQDDLELETDDLTQPRIHYQLSTHQGSSALELDGAGEILSYEEYFPYGGTAFIAGDRARSVDLKEYRYSGKERDDATGLYDYGYRYYAPWIARWLSPDPIGPEDDLNLYQFVLGDPVGNVDEDGLETKPKGSGRGGGKGNTRSPLTRKVRMGGYRKVERSFPPDKDLKPGHTWIPSPKGSGYIQITNEEADKRGITVYTPVRDYSADTGGSGADRAGDGARTGNGGGPEPSPGGTSPGPDAGNQGLGAQDTGGDGGGGQGTQGAGGNGHGEGAVGSGGQSQVGDGQGSQSQGVGTVPGDGTGASSSSIGGGKGVNPGNGSGGGSAGDGGTGTSPGGGMGPGRGAGTGGTGIGGGTGDTGKGPGGGRKGTGRGAASGGVADGIGAGRGSADGFGTGAGAGLDLGSGSQIGSGFGRPTLLSLGTGAGAGSSQDLSTGGSGNSAQPSSLAGGGGGPSNMSTGGTPGRHGLGRAIQSDGGIPGASGAQDGSLDESMFDQPSDSLGESEGGESDGRLDGSEDEHIGRPGGKPGGSTHPDANPDAGRADGRLGGAPTTDSSGPAGTETAPRGAWGTIVRWAGYANFEFGGSSRRGSSGGVPGGRGSANLGWFGQALYVAFTIVSWIGPMAAFKAVSTGFRIAMKGTSLVLRATTRLATRLSSVATRTLSAVRQIPSALARRWNGARAHLTGGFMLDNNVLSWTHSGYSHALTFMERNAGRLYVNTRIIGEFLKKRTRAEYLALAEKYGIRELRTFESKGRALMTKLKKTSKKAPNDISVVVTARHYSLRIVSGDYDVLSAALRSGYRKVSARRFVDGEDITEWYKALRADSIPKWAKDADPLTITGSPRRR